LLDGGCGYEEYRFPTPLAHLRFSSAAQWGLELSEYPTRLDVADS
jgi:hypothetical protein